VVGKVLVQYFIRTVESGLPTLSTPLNYSPACPSLLAVNRESEVLFRLRSAKEGWGGGGGGGGGLGGREF